MGTFYAIYLVIFFFVFMPFYVYSYWGDIFGDDDHNKNNNNDK